jgi:hypothetical protein
MTTESIILKPRPYARYSGSLLLLPLLPQRPPFKSLPFEIWTEIFKFSLNSGTRHLRRSLLTVCKIFHVRGHPLTETQSDQRSLPVSHRKSHSPCSTHMFVLVKSHLWTSFVPNYTWPTESGTLFVEYHTLLQADGCACSTSPSCNRKQSYSSILSSNNCSQSSHFSPIWHCTRRSCSVGTQWPLWQAMMERSSYVS